MSQIIHTRFTDQNYHPHITGYWYLLLNIPEDIIKKADGNYDSKTMAKLLNSCAESFTPPSRSINKAEIIAFSNIKKFVAVGQTINNSFNLSLREYFGTPISNIINIWTEYIVSSPTGKINKKYKGNCLVIIAKPTVSGQDKLDKKDIEQVYFFQGIYPEADTIDKFSSNIASNDGLSLDITFNFDGHIIRKDFNLEKFISDYNTTIGDWTKVVRTKF